MKVSIWFYVALTSLILVTLTVMVALGAPINWVFYLTCLGEVLVVVMVYRVLTEHYVTEKQFDDFYEDHPVGNEERHIQ